METIKSFRESLNKLMSELSKYDDGTKMVIELDDNCGGFYHESIENFSLNYDGETVSLSNL